MPDRIDRIGDQGASTVMRSQSASLLHVL